LPQQSLTGVRKFAKSQKPGRKTIGNKKKIDIETDIKKDTYKAETGSAIMTAKIERAKQNKKAYLRQASLDKLLLRSLKKEKDEKQLRLD